MKVSVSGTQTATSARDLSLPPLAPVNAITFISIALASTAAYRTSSLFPEVEMPKKTSPAFQP